MTTRDAIKKWLGSKIPGTIFGLPHLTKMVRQITGSQVMDATVSKEVRRMKSKWKELKYEVIDRNKSLYRLIEVK